MASAWLDFDAIRRNAPFATILAHYGLKTSGVGERRFILCPFHSESTPSCSVNLGKAVFHCFGCGAKGTIIDFVSLIDRVELREAAVKIVRICGMSSHELAAERIATVATSQHSYPEPNDAPKSITPIELDPTHPYLSQRGLKPDTIALFGLGYSCTGPMRGRVCIPIHHIDGTLVAYAGRWATDPVPQGVPRYLFTRGFRKREVLFNLHRVTRSDRLVLVEGYWSAIRLHGLDLPVAALMGCSTSPAHIALLKQRSFNTLCLLMDGDTAGVRSRPKVLEELARDFYVRAPLLPTGEKPDSISSGALLELM